MYSYVCRLFTVCRKFDMLKYCDKWVLVAAVLNFWLIFHRHAKYHPSSTFSLYSAAVLKSNFTVSTVRPALVSFCGVFLVLITWFIPISNSKFHWIWKVLQYSCGTFRPTSRRDSHTPAPVLTILSSGLPLVWKIGKPGICRSWKFVREKWSN